MCWSLELEAPPGIEPGMEVLQTSALPLGDGAVERGGNVAKYLRVSHFRCVLISRRLGRTLRVLVRSC
jgi:hypothetical protein